LISEVNDKHIIQKIISICVYLFIFSCFFVKFLQNLNKKYIRYL